MADTDDLDDQHILACTAWGEARGEGAKGMQAVINTIVNRANKPRWWGNDIRSVCLKRFQYSSWNIADPNREKMLTLDDSDPVYATALNLAAQAIAGSLEDITGGATSYYASSMAQPPQWAIGRDPTTIIGHHIFFIDV